MKLFKKISDIFRKRPDLTAEEQIALAKKKYCGMALVNKILEIEGIGERDPRWYYRLIDLCAEYKVNFTIPNSEGGPC